MNLIINGSSLINLTISKLALCVDGDSAGQGDAGVTQDSLRTVGQRVDHQLAGPDPVPVQHGGPAAPQVVQLRPRQFQPLGALPVGPENEGRSVTMATAPVLQHVVHRLVGKLNSHRLKGWDTS